MNPATSRNLLFVIVAAAGLYLMGNGAVALWDRDEPRYAQTSRQMLRSGDWVVPRYLDKVRTAKPVFIYWCQAAAMRVLGDEGDRGVFAARLPSVVAMTAVLGILAVVLSRFASAAHAFWTVFIFSTTALVVWSAKACTTDAVLLLGITVAQLCLYALWQGNASWPVVVTLSVAIAQAGLTKGPVVLGVMGMTLAALSVFRWIDRRMGRKSRPTTPSPGPPREGGGEGARRTSGLTSRESGAPLLPARPHPNPLPEYRARGPEQARRVETAGIIARILVATLIVAALVAPWVYLVQERESQFLGTSVRHDVLRRIAQPLEGHRGPPGYHLALVFGTFLPWSLLLPMALVFGWKHRGDARVRFALAAAVGPWLMFELVRTKLPHYMLPAFPPLAFLMADAVVRGLRGEHDDLRRRAFKIGGTILCLGAVGLGIIPLVLAHRFGQDIRAALPVTLITLGFAVSVAARVLLFRPQRDGLVAIGVGAAAVYAVVFGMYLPRAESLRVSPRTAAILIQHGATEPGSVVMIDYKEPSLAFYQGGTIREESVSTLTHDLLDRSPPWLVITARVWSAARPAVRDRLEVVGTVRGLGYANGRVVETMVVRQRRADGAP